MKMKLSYLSLKFLIISFFFISVIIRFSKSTTFENKFTLQNHFSMMMQFKAQTKTLLNNLFDTANTHASHFESKVKNNHKSERITSKITKNLRRNLLKSKVISHTSDLQEKDIMYTQYRYKRYQEILDTLKKFAQEYPDYLKIESAQKLYNLPYPGGYCGPNKEKCEHWIAFLSNHKLEKNNKHQIFFSGEVHGDEHIGPTAMIEMIELILKNKDNPWFKHLLDNRYVVIVPMTNPHGYYEKIREELLIEDEDAAVLTSSKYMRTHKDINRDFPYLVKHKNCMETIGARVVNELYINHLFSLALSLHGGTESLTYPYGTPNHMAGNKTPKIPMKYSYDEEGKLKYDSSPPEALNIAKRYRTGVFDMIGGKSSESPDHNALKNIAETASIHTTPNSKLKYITGDMTGVVYPVTGGMEDWAYSGSWEGFPIITQPCKPKTYGGYNPEKTLYDKNYKDALKSIMFLLEVSHEKIPEQRQLGRRNWDCLINIRHNSFFNKIAPNKHKCLDPYIDGYIPRIIRLSLLLIDILQPYVNSRYTVVDQKNLLVEWSVGGAISIDDTFILYDYFENIPQKDFILKIEEMKNPVDAIKYLTNSTKHIKGKAVWEKTYSPKDYLNYTFENIEANGKYILYAIYAKVDQGWGNQYMPDPQVPPQTHISNIRTKDDYKAKNAQYEINGQLYYRSKIIVLKTSNLNKEINTEIN